MINILGKDRKIKFNIYGIEQMQNKKRAGSEMSAVYAMVWGGLEGALYEAGEDADFVFGDVIDAIDGMTSEKRNEVISVFNKLLLESQAFKSLVPDVEETGKKKVSRKSSTKT